MYYGIFGSYILHLILNFQGDHDYNLQQAL